MKTTICLLVAAALAMPGIAGAQEAEPIADVKLTFNPDAVSLPDVAGEPALHALLHVENLQGLAVVLVVLRVPDDAALATVQDVQPPGWAAKWTRTSVEFVGHLEAGQGITLPVRIVDSLAAREGAFEIFVHTVDAALSFGIATPLQALAPDTGNYRCQLVIVSRVDDRVSFLPVASLSEVVPTSADLLVAVYDRAYGTYIDPAAVGGEVRVEGVGFGLDTLTLPLDAIADAPFLDTAAGPVLTLPVASIGVRAATLWGADASPARDWFERHPGAFLIEADVTLAGEPLTNCQGVAYSFVGSLSPEAELAPLSPFAVVPPELDSDVDGYANIAELRANSNPVDFRSTPYSDDDGDGVPNGRDLVSVPRAPGA